MFSVVKAAWLKTLRGFFFFFFSKALQRCVPREWEIYWLSTKTFLEKYKGRLVKEGPSVNGWIQTPACWLSRQRHWKHSIKPKAIKLFSIWYLLPLLWHTIMWPLANTGAKHSHFSSLPPDGSIENRCRAAVCLLLRAGVVMDSLMIIKHLLCAENKQRRWPGRELNTYVIRLKRSGACAQAALIRRHKPSADVPPIEVRGSRAHPQKAAVHTSSQAISIMANWLFAQCRERLVSTKGRVCDGLWSPQMPAGVSCGFQRIGAAGPAHKGQGRSGEKRHETGDDTSCDKKQTGWAAMSSSVICLLFSGDMVTMATWRRRHQSLCNKIYKTMFYPCDNGGILFQLMWFIFIYLHVPS